MQIVALVSYSPQVETESDRKRRIDEEDVGDGIEEKRGKQELPGGKIGNF